jgi:LPXTG-motif cell wall-anchored protein
LRTFRFGRLLATLLVFTLLAPGVAVANSHSMQMGDSMQMMDEAMSDLERLNGEDFEVAYVNQIVAHHQAALDMSQAVVDRASNQEVRDAAAKIIEDQQMEIDDLTTFLQEKYDRQVNPDERMAMDPSMMEQLRSADPATAEKMFLLGMREHHEIAIQMGEITLEKAQSEEILSQAETMVRTQGAEQQEFAGYLQDFYGIEAPTPTGDMERAMQLARNLPQTGGLSLVSAAVAAGGAILAVAGLFLRRRLVRY